VPRAQLLATPEADAADGLREDSLAYEAVFGCDDQIRPALGPRHLP